MGKLSERVWPPALSLLAEFDENYAAPGAVLQDPTLPGGNLMMLYEVENHCPGGVNQQPYYATVDATSGTAAPASRNKVRETASLNSNQNSTEIQRASHTVAASLPYALDLRLRRE